MYEQRQAAGACGADLSMLTFEPTLLVLYEGDRRYDIDYLTEL
jgi:hypothetical protein